MPTSIAKPFIRRNRSSERGNALLISLVLTSVATIFVMNLMPMVGFTQRATLSEQQRVAAGMALDGFADGIKEYLRQQVCVRDTNLAIVACDSIATTSQALYSSDAYFGRFLLSRQKINDPEGPGSFFTPSRVGDRTLALGWMSEYSKTGLAKDDFTESHPLYATLGGFLRHPFYNTLSVFIRRVTNVHYPDSMVILRIRVVMNAANPLEHGPLEKILEVSFNPSSLHNFSMVAHDLDLSGSSGAPSGVTATIKPPGAPVSKLDVFRGYHGLNFVDPIYLNGFDPGNTTIPGEPGLAVFFGAESKSFVPVRIGHLVTPGDLYEYDSAGITKVPLRAPANGSAGGFVTVNDLTKGRIHHLDSMEKRSNIDKGFDYLYGLGPTTFSPPAAATACLTWAQRTSLSQTAKTQFLAKRDSETKATDSRNLTDILALGGPNEFTLPTGSGCDVGLYNSRKSVGLEDMSITTPSDRRALATISVIFRDIAANSNVPSNFLTAEGRIGWDSVFKITTNKFDASPYKAAITKAENEKDSAKTTLDKAEDAYNDYKNDTYPPIKAVWEDAKVNYDKYDPQPPPDDSDVYKTFQKADGALTKANGTMTALNNAKNNAQTALNSAITAYNNAVAVNSEAISHDGQQGTITIKASPLTVDGDIQRAAFSINTTTKNEWVFTHTKDSHTGKSGSHYDLDGGLGLDIRIKALELGTNSNCGSLRNSSNQMSSNEIQYKLFETADKKGFQNPSVSSTDWETKNPSGSSGPNSGYEPAYPKNDQAIAKSCTGVSLADRGVPDFSNQARTSWDFNRAGTAFDNNTYKASDPPPTITFNATNSGYANSNAQYIFPTYSYVDTIRIVDVPGIPADKAQVVAANFAARELHIVGVRTSRLILIGTGIIKKLTIDDPASVYSFGVDWYSSHNPVAMAILSETGRLNAESPTRCSTLADGGYNNVCFGASCSKNNLWWNPVLSLRMLAAFIGCSETATQATGANFDWTSIDPERGILGAITQELPVQKNIKATTIWEMSKGFTNFRFNNR